MKVNRKITMMALAGIALGGLTLIVSGDAALAQDTVRVRGAIESIDGSTYVIRARDGAELKVALVFFFFLFFFFCGLGCRLGSGVCLWVGLWGVLGSVGVGRVVGARRSWGGRAAGVRVAAALAGGRWVARGRFAARAVSCAGRFPPRRGRAFASCARAARAGRPAARRAGRALVGDTGARVGRRDRHASTGDMRVDLRHTCPAPAGSLPRRRTVSRTHSRRVA